jgi:hypothetical protein
MRRFLLVAGLLALFPVLARPNNAWRLRIALDWSAGSNNLNWVSLPYHFYPNGNVGQLPQNSVDLCTALNNAPRVGSPVAMVGQWDVLTSRMRMQSCPGFIKAFDLEPGRGYALVPDAASRLVEIIGSHDDSYSANKTGPVSTIPLIWDPSSTNLNWIAVPATVGAANALELCLLVNGGPAPTQVTHISRLQRDLWTVQDCTAATSAFDLDPALSYAFTPAGAGRAIAWETDDCSNVDVRGTFRGVDVALSCMSTGASSYDLFRRTDRGQACSAPFATAPTCSFLDLGARTSAEPVLFYDIQGR